MFQPTSLLHPKQPNLLLPSPPMTVRPKRKAWHEPLNRVVKDKSSNKARSEQPGKRGGRGSEKGKREGGEAGNGRYVHTKAEQASCQCLRINEIIHNQNSQ